MMTSGLNNRRSKTGVINMSTPLTNSLIQLTLHPISYTFEVRLNQWLIKTFLCLLSKFLLLQTSYEHHSHSQHNGIETHEKVLFYVFVHVFFVGMFTVLRSRHIGEPNLNNTGAGNTKGRCSISRLSFIE